MDKVQAYIEGAHEARKAVVAEKMMEKLRSQREQSEKEALQLANLRDFLVNHIPDDLMQFVRFPRGHDLFTTMRLPLELPGCIPVEMIICCGDKDHKFYFRDNPWIVPSLQIYEPYFDEDEGEIFTGRVGWAWNHAAGEYDWCYAKGLSEAIGMARERFLALAEADAEHKQRYDELTIQARERAESTIREMYNRGAVKAEPVYAPVNPVISDAPVAEMLVAMEKFMRMIARDEINGGAE
jgi:hypothetical protein